MDYVNKITVGSPGIQVLLLDTGSPLIKDSSGSVIPYKIIFSDSESEISLVIVKFPTEGDYYVYEDTPQEDTTTFVEHTISDQGTTYGTVSIKKNYRFLPLGTRLVKNPYWDTSEHIQGGAYYNGKLYIATTRSIGVLDIHTMEVKKLLDISDLASRTEQNHIDDFDVDRETGYAYIPVMKWNSTSDYGYGEIVVLDLNTLKIVKRCYLGDNVEASALAIVGDYIYLGQYSNNTIKKLNKSDCSIVGDFSSIPRPNGIIYLPEYDALLVKTDDGELYEWYLVPISNPTNKEIIGYFRRSGAGMARIGNTLILPGRWYPNGPNHIALWGITESDSGLSFGDTTTDGSNRILDTGVQYDSAKTYMLYVVNEHCTSPTNTNKAPGIALVSDSLDSGIIVEQSGGNVNLASFSSTTNNVEQETQLQFIYNADTTNHCRTGYGVVFIKYDGNTATYGFIDPNHTYATNKYQYSTTVSKVAIRIWRLATLYGKLIETSEDPTIANITSIEYNEKQESTPSTNTSSTSSSKIILAILGLLELLLLLGRKRR